MSGHEHKGHEHSHELYSEDGISSVAYSAQRTIALFGLQGDDCASARNCTPGDRSAIADATDDDYELAHGCREFALSPGELLTRARFAVRILTSVAARRGWLIGHIKLYATVHSERADAESSDAEHANQSVADAGHAESADAPTADFFISATDEEQITETVSKEFAELARNIAALSPGRDGSKPRPTSDFQYEKYDAVLRAGACCVLGLTVIVLGADEEEVAALTDGVLAGLLGARVLKNVN